MDTGTNTGWCYGIDQHALPTWGVIEVDGISDLAASYVGLDNELADLIALLRPSRVAYEAPLSYTAGARDPRVPLLLMGLAAHVESCCYRSQVRAFPRNVNIVRKHVIGRGSFRKPLAGEGKWRRDKGTNTPVLRGDPKEEVRLWAASIGWASITEPNARDAALLLRYELTFEMRGRTTASAGSAAA